MNGTVGLVRYGLGFCYTRAIKTGNYCLKPITNGYKHPCLKWESNP